MSCVQVGGAVLALGGLVVGGEGEQELVVREAWCQVREDDRQEIHRSLHKISLIKMKVYKEILIECGISSHLYQH